MLCLQLTPGDPNVHTARALDFWRSIATQYKDKKHLLYEIANEPNGVSWQTIKNYHNQVIAAIRQIDPNTIIICGTTTFSQGIDEAANDPVAQPFNVMYTFHFYAATHGFLFQRVVDNVKRIPIFATEWGVSEASGNGNIDLTTAKRFLDLFSGATSGVQVSWLMWAFGDVNESSAFLKPGSCAAQLFAQVTCGGAYIVNVLRITALDANQPPPVATGSPTTKAPTPPPGTQPPGATGSPTTKAPTPPPGTQPPGTQPPGTLAPSQPPAPGQGLDLGKTLGTGAVVALVILLGFFVYARGYARGRSARTNVDPLNNKLAYGRV